MHTPDYEKAEDLLRDADTAMYRAKGSGRACHVVFHRGMHHFVMARLQLETDLRRAIDRGQLQVHYQPFVDLLTGEVIGFEALLRWEHPLQGLVLPDDFLDRGRGDRPDPPHRPLRGERVLPPHPRAAAPLRPATAACG